MLMIGLLLMNPEAILHVVKSQQEVVFIHFHIFSGSFIKELIYFWKIM